jgi:nucleobase:cation symporter-1, NCS1 family
MAFHATQGPVFGLPQMIQTRAQLGYRGVVVALFAVLFTYMAFNVADQVLLASGLNGAFGWNPTLVAIVTAILAAALAIFGYDWVHRVFRFLLVISFPCYAIISVAILVGHAGGTAPAHPGGFVFAAFMSQFSVAAAYNITYAPYVSDYSRYGVDYSWVVGLLVSGLVYLVLSRSLDLKAEQAAIKASERELQTIDQETR